MADTQTVTYELKCVLLFDDGDTSNLNIPQPRSDVTSAQIVALSNLIAANNLIVGDKYGGNFVRIQLATKRTVTKTKLDLS